MTTAAFGIWLRVAGLVVVLFAGVGAMLTAGLPSVGTVRAWVDGAGVPGLAAVVLGCALVLLTPVPRSALSALLGVVAGLWTGVALAFASGLLAALAAFGLSRVLGRSAVVRIAGRRAARVDQLLTDRPFLSVLTGRLLPVVPFVALSYGAGLTGVRLAPYAAATAIGLVPSTLVQVGLGASAAGVVDTVVVVALVGVAVVIGALAWRRRRAVTA